MATKTLTITEDAYNLLANNKLDDESFSEEIRRIMTKKRARPLSDFFGILSEEEGEDIIKVIEDSRKADIALEKKRR